MIAAAVVAVAAAVAVVVAAVVADPAGGSSVGRRLPSVPVAVRSGPMASASEHGDDRAHRPAPPASRVVTERMPEARGRLSSASGCASAAATRSAELAGASHFLEHLLFKGTERPLRRGDRRGGRRRWAAR